MATTTVTPAPEPQAPINHFGRMIGVFSSPRKTFEDIAKRPSWLVPLVLMVVLGTAVGVMLNTKMNWGQYIRQKAEQSPRFADLSEEQKERALAPQVKYAPYFSYAIGILNVPIAALFFGLIYWGAFNLFTGAGLRFGSSFAITTHAFVPGIIHGALALIVLPLKVYGEVEPETIVATSVSAFLSESAPKWLVSLGNSLELFWLWFLVLIAVGFSAANPKKIKPATAFSTVLGLWGVWVLIKVAWAAL